MKNRNKLRAIGQCCICNSEILSYQTYKGWKESLSHVYYTDCFISVRRSEREMLFDEIQEIKDRFNRHENTRADLSNEPEKESKKIKYTQLYKKCQTCNGAGGYNWEACKDCETGLISVEAYTPENIISVFKDVSMMSYRELINKLRLKTFGSTEVLVHPGQLVTKSGIPGVVMDNQRNLRAYEIRIFSDNRSKIWNIKDVISKGRHILGDNLNE